MGTIQRAAEADLPQILDLQNLCYAKENYSPPVPPTLEKLKHEIQNMTFFTLTDGGKVLGTVRVAKVEDIVVIGKLFLHPDLTDAEGGKKLLEAAEGAFPGSKKYEISAGLHTDQYGKVYKSAGYQIAREEKVSDTLTLVYLEKSK